MSLQEIPRRIFYRITSNGVFATVVSSRDLIVGQCYILVVDKYNFDKGKDVEIYKIISNTKADVYKANKYNYHSVITTEREPSVPQSRPPEPPPLKNKSLYQSITIDGKQIRRVICDNQTIWQNTNATPKKTNEWQSLWSGILSINEVRLPAYKTYGFRSGPHQIFKRAEDLIGLYDSLNGNTLVARFDSIANELIVSGFGQSTVEIFGKN
ncbi:hypothetical protein H7672_02100 [Streptococcus dysgalactiae subsp. equisimilis]|uniref:hypothetical protein n=1 Tax=Streptococcus dysgalactiae TaxID=1334 RepID=UPI00194FBE18|nr:hypothetical protein [Streptococcus dysgalactiae]MBM6513440.1 hypothetical protein [Streptococcus dysgalactiae subsp. equisimilis]